MTVHDYVAKPFPILGHVPRIALVISFCEDGPLGHRGLGLVATELDLFSDDKVAIIDLSRADFAPLLDQVPLDLAEVLGLKEDSKAFVLNLAQAFGSVSPDYLYPFGIKDWLVSEVFVHVTAVSFLRKHDTGKVDLLELELHGERIQLGHLGSKVSADLESSLKSRSLTKDKEGIRISVHDPRALGLLPLAN